MLPAEDAGSIRAKSEAYEQELSKLHSWVGEQIQSIPAPKRVLITAHDAFGYFGRAYGIEVRGLQGISTSSEFGLRDVKNLADFVIERRIPSVFVESSVPKKFIEALQSGVRERGFDLTIGGELFSDALGVPGGVGATYVEMIHHNVSTIVDALQ